MDENEAMWTMLRVLGACIILGLFIMPPDRLTKSPRGEILGGLFFSLIRRGGETKSDLRRETAVD